MARCGMSSLLLYCVSRWKLTNVDLLYDSLFMDIDLWRIVELAALPRSNSSDDPIRYGSHHDSGWKDYISLE